jgi:superfamily II DNA or RNA helicase
MRFVALPDKSWPAIDTTSLVTAAGATSYDRGVQYLREGAVTRMSWDGGRSELYGSVRGSAGSCYETVAYFHPAGPSVLEFDQGQCSCPVGFDCKHVVALVLAASQAQLAGTGLKRTAGARARALTWEQSVESWLEPQTAARDGGPGGGGQPAAALLGIELSLVPDARPAFSGDPAAGDAPPRLMGRLVQPGRKGWVGRSLSWTKLDSQYGYDGWPPPQVQLLQEIYAVYRARSGQPLYYGYGYGDDKSIDLSAFESRQLWALLDEAAALGLRLVRGRNLGPLDGYHTAELCLDLTRADQSGPLVIAPQIRVDGAPATITVISFIGTEGHGLVYADRAETQRTSECIRWRFQLARTVKPVPPQLQQMALAGQRVEIPAAELTRFGETYYPRLRAAATVISSDDAFTPPQITGPTLLLHADYTGRHDLELSCAWGYQVGDSPVRVPVAGPAAGVPYRDRAAERAIVAGLGLTPGRFGLLRTDPVSDEPQPSLAPQVRLSGLDTMRFSTELLPQLAGHPDVTVEITGDPADYREAGDSLAISVSADEVPDDHDWFDLGITITVAGQEVPFADVFVALSRGEPYLLLASGSYFSLQKPELQALARLIEEARVLHDAPGDGLKISRFQAGFWAELTGLGIVSRQARRWQQQVSGLLSAEARTAPELPRTLNAELRPYQRDGFGWLAFLWQHQLGGILADDMGLGKTLQSLALICQAREADPDLPPFLIVAPTSVVSNWAAEAARFAPDLPVVAITGTAARRGQSLGEIAAGAGAVVTSYTLLRMDFAAYSGLTWAGLILDEAQNVKNHQSKTYLCARRLAAPVKIAITGTPMENNLMELWSLLSITAPGLFPDPGRFREYYAKPIERDGQADMLAQLRRRIRPLVLRRTKEQVAADLPAKQEQVLEVELHPRHRKLYQTHLQRERQKVLSLIDDLDSNRFTILRSLTLLRQLSLHGALIDDAHLDLPCAKIDLLLSQLQDVAAGGHRALVFSQFTRFLGQVRERLEAAGIEYRYLDGKTRDRAAEVARFKNGTAPAFLISLKAGGFGLNLTEADYCFLLDPWWNPATEAQAVDRTHRIGQSRNVMVYRLISAGTIEEKVLALQARKAELFTSVLDSGGVFSGSLDADDIRALFT